MIELGGILELPTCLRINRELHKKFSEHYSLADDCLVLGDLILGNLADRKPKESDFSLYQIVLTADYNKATESLLSLSHLCNAGFTEDGNTIARKLLEIAVNLKYLSEDVEGRINQFWHYGCVSNYFTLLKIRKGNLVSQWLKKEFEERAPEIEQVYHDCKHYYELDKNGEVRRDFRNSWSGKSLMVMANECGLAGYWGAYQIFNISTHSSIDTILAFFDLEKLEFKSAYSEDKIPPLILLGVEMFLVVTELVIFAHGLNLEDSLKQVRNRFEQQSTTLGAKM